MNNFSAKVKKAWRVFRRDGVSVFIHKTVSFLTINGRKVLFIVYYPFIYFALQRESEQKRDSRSAIDFIYSHFNRFLEPGQVKEEITSLAKLVDERKPKQILEIGTSGGGNLYVLSKILASGGTITSIDLPGGKFGGGYGFFKSLLYKKFVSKDKTMHLLRVDSHRETSVDTLKNILHGEKLDFLFIDGDHTYKGVKKDFEMYSGFVRSGGIIAFHDIVEHSIDTNCDVYRFWNEVKIGKKYTEFIVDKKQGWAGIGVLFA
jgi:predicted O-methyltransferase YrrM